MSEHRNELRLQQQQQQQQQPVGGGLKGGVMANSVMYRRSESMSSAGAVHDDGGGVVVGGGGFCFDDGVSAASGYSAATGGSGSIGTAGVAGGGSTVSSGVTGGGYSESFLNFTGRVPAALQSVFLASNRGRSVHSAPPERIASRTFYGRRPAASNDPMAPNSIINTSVCVSSASSVGSCASSFADSRSSLGGSKRQLDEAACVGDNNDDDSSRSAKRHGSGKQMILPNILPKRGLADAAASRLDADEREDDGVGTQESGSTPEVSSPSVAQRLSSSSLHCAGAATTAAASVVTSSASGEPNLSSTKDETAPSNLVKVSPQDYLDEMISSRGYSTERYPALSSSYANKPTPLQIASYDVYIAGVVRRGDVDTFRGLMGTGISPNPCNRFGESLLHMVCRRGDVGMVRVMSRASSSFAVTDDYGRTPLHDACWAARPAFDVVDVILRSTNDKLADGSAVDLTRLFYVTDKRGSAPLSYVREEQWDDWIQFLQSKRDEYWPIRGGGNGTAQPQGPPELTLFGPDTRPVQDPDNALPIELAQMVARGRIRPRDVPLVLREEDEDEDSWESDSDDEDTDYDSDGDADMTEVVHDDTLGVGSLHQRQQQQIQGAQIGVSGIATQAARDNNNESNNGNGIENSSTTCYSSDEDDYSSSVDSDCSSSFDDDDMDDILNSVTMWGTRRA